MSGKAWVNGKIVDSFDSFFSLGALHYGAVVFDGILCIAKAQKHCFLFRLYEHINRIFYSAQVLGLKIPYSKDEFAKAVIDLIKYSGCSSYYIRPLVFSNKFYTNILPKNKKESVNVVILYKKFNFWKFVFQMKIKLKVMISRKIINIWTGELALAKISGKYLSYLMALVEAKENNFDDAIILDEKQKISEASTSNIFIVKNNVIKTPLCKNILPGVTRASVIEIAKKIGYQVYEGNISAEELFNSDEIFFTNTARGIISTFQIEKSNKIKQDKITRLIREKYLDIIRGRDSEYFKWLTPVNI